MENKTGVVFNIQRYSLHDGNGIRTNIFLKGCPLRCKWCSNPESQKYYSEIAINPANCMGCGMCEQVCPEGAISQKGWIREKCRHCNKCEDVCPTGALEYIGKTTEVEQVVERVLKDVPFYQTSGGGATFSGGEPLTQSEFVAAVAQELKRSFIHLAIETSGYAPWEQAEQVFAEVDQILYDIKHMDEEKHKELTGVSNKLILENAAKAAKLGKHMAIRIPVIGGYNADEENIRKTAEFAKEIGVSELHLLPYHRFGESKYKKLKMDYTCEDAYELGDEEMNRLGDIAHEYGLTVSVGG